MIKIADLTKTFKRRLKKSKRKFERITAVDHINLSIKKGEILGFIGPNGAGKTTTLKILSTLILPDEGSATIDGHDVVKEAHIVRTEVGLLAGEFVRSLYWRLNARQNLKFFAHLRGIWEPDARIDYLIDLFHLNEWENELVMKFSTGMKHKLALAAGLLHDPSILFLDEPLTGIDPLTAYEIKNLIRTEFNDKTIIWASHNLYEIEEMCDRIALVNKGRVVLEGVPAVLKKSLWDHTKIVVESSNPQAFLELENTEVKDNIVEIKTNDINKTIFDITLLARQKHVDIIEIKTLRPTLEDIFMKEVSNV